MDFDLCCQFSIRLLHLKQISSRCGYLKHNIQC